MERHRDCSGRRADRCRGGYCGLLLTRAGTVRDIAVIESQQPVSDSSTSRATVQSASKPPPPNSEPWHPGRGEGQGSREKHKGRLATRGQGRDDREGQV